VVEVTELCVLLPVSASPPLPVVVVVAAVATLPKLLGASVRTWPWLLTIEILIGADETPPLPAPLELFPAPTARFAPPEPRRVPPAPPSTLLLELTAADDAAADARDRCSHCDRP